MKLPLSPSLLWCTALAVLLTACGGDSAPAKPPLPEPLPDPVPVPVPVYADAAAGSALQLWNRCETMHAGFPQNWPGTQAEEKGFIRAIMEETYLWDSELPTLKGSDYPNVVAYFNALKSPQLLASGRSKDRFHFSYPNETWLALSSGIELGYGISWSVGANRIPRQWRAAMIDEASPAAVAGIRRGDMLVMIDGVDFINRGDAAAVAKFNAALAPADTAQRHTFTWWRDGRMLETTLSGISMNASPVRNVRVLDTPAGKTGYLSFVTHNGPAERQLYDAISQFRAAGIQELVLDLRYNGGGLVAVASQLAYMIAGPSASAGKTFMRYSTNGKLEPGRPTAFIDKALGLTSPQPLLPGVALPHLDLKRVTLLTGPATCSASEALINGLRGIDVEVRQIGGQTCGKPYAFVPMQNCGVTYFFVQYQGLNQRGWGDYADGFAPECEVDDDMEHALGDPAEGMLAVALRRNAGLACSVASAPRQGGRPAMRVAGAEDAATVQVRSPLKEIAILPESR